MLSTSYFAKSARTPGAVSIARFPPKWYAGPRYVQLAPLPEMLRIGNWEEYRMRYREEILAPLDPDEVLAELAVLAGGPDIILLCFEKDRSHCHRGLVAEWFREKRGLPVPELGDTGTQATLG